MSISGSIAVFVIIWWLVFFMVLPIGSREVVDQSDVSTGQDAGAPKKTRLLFKTMISTIISIAVFALFYWLVDSGHVYIGPDPK
jgi:predicted secreted protein